MIRFLQTEGPFKKIVLSGLLLLICAAMAITLIPGGLGNDLMGTPGKGIVAKVSGEDITVEQVKEAARNMAQQQAQQYGANASMLMPFLMQRATQQAANQLIDRQALVTEAQHLGLRATLQEVQDDLQHGRYAGIFFPGGNFIGEAEYKGMLQQHNLTPATFEDGVGKEILISKLQALITGSASVSDEAIRKEFTKQNTKVKFEYAVLKEDDIKKGLHPTVEELKAYYDSHQKNYANSVPEKRKIKYAVLDTGKVQGGVQVTHDDLQAYYNQRRDQYRVPEQIKVSHIWIKMPLPGPDGKIDDKGVADAQRRAEELLKQLQNGAKFEDVAKKSSEDTGSANVGGSLGWIGKSQMGAEFEKAAASLPKGKISGVVKTLDGFHIIRVDDRQDAHMKTLDEVKAEIEPAVKQQKTQEAAQKQAEDLLQQAKTKGLEVAAAAKGVQVVTSDFFGRRDLVPGLGPAPQFMDAVFGAAEKSAPEMASTSQGFAVFQLLAVKAPSTPTFDEIRTQVEQQFKNERANVLLSQKTQELSDRAKSEHDLKKAAKELGASVKTSDFVLPDGQVPDIGSMTGEASVAFGMKPGDISAPINGQGSGAVISVLEVQPPADTDFAAKRDQIRETLLQGKQQEIFGLFLTSLRDQMEKSGKIKINQDELKALTKAGSEPGI
ncbi:MAG TPA: peptidyl-prolyl cis-trans isomerase [Candidatus Acidoferrum sp.]|jgi:peptidyl-prolyl cis-trans isomerase D|nr:peptidyl-prolyl cis-trans isomerase [Candidatus Acidoferrum sp.]